MPGDLERRIRETLARLELVSHVSAVSLDPSSRDTSEDIGGKRPTGGIVSWDDHAKDEETGEPEPYPQKSFMFYREEFAKARTDARRERLLRDADAALDAARRSPTPVAPLLGDPLWKRWVAESDMPVKDIVRIYGVSRQYVHRVRREYRDAA